VTPALDETLPGIGLLHDAAIFLDDPTRCFKVSSQFARMLRMVAYPTEGVCGRPLSDDGVEFPWSQAPLKAWRAELRE
jgi:hypothetical protein